MESMNKDARASKILQIMDEVENSPLTIKQYFKEKNPPFGRAQYYLYKKALREKGVAGLHDQRSKGNNLKFTNDMKNFAKGLIVYNRSMPSAEVQNAIKNEFGVIISNTVIKNFRIENDLNWIRPKKGLKPFDESGASEISIALALGTGLIDTITDSICQCVQKKRESKEFRESELIQKDHPDLRSNGRFTSEYNKLPHVKELRFKSLDEKIGVKRFASMNIFSLSRESIMRYTVALFSLPQVTANGRFRSVDNPKGNALKYLCGLNYKASTLDKHLSELKYLQVSNELIEAIAKFWIDFWGKRNKLDSISACYYIDGNTKALWSSKSCHKGRVAMLGRVMNCLEQVFIHDGQGHPIYFQTFNGHADLGKNALKMMDTLSEYLEATTTLEGQFTVNRILIMDAAGNGVNTLRGLSSSDSDYYYITMLDSNQFNERKIKSISGEKRYDYGNAHLVDCTLELEDSNDKGYIFETRAVQVYWDNGRTSVLITSVPETIFSTDYVVKSYFDRWPAQELDFKDMKGGVNLHRVVGYGKKLVDNKKVLERIEQLQGQISELERELDVFLNEIRGIERNLEARINDERKYREKSTVVNGERKLSERDTEILASIQKEINSLKRRIKKIEKSHEKPFKSLKKKKEELARIIDKKKIYRVDVELDQIMTCFRISFANICSYMLDECFKGEKMTLQRLFETIFDLRGKVKVENDQRNIFIERNPKQENIMRKLELALEALNRMGVKDVNNLMYKFQLV
jgi:transposase